MSTEATYSTHDPSSMVATLICPTSFGLSRSRVAALTIVRKTTETLYRENGEGMAKFKALLMQECYKR